MIEPKRPEGDSPRARYMQWLHDSIKQMQPIAVRGMKMGNSQRGSYRIFEPQEIGPKEILSLEDPANAYRFYTYSQQLLVAGHESDTFTFEIADGVLPTGLTMSSSGIISGTGTEVFDPATDGISLGTARTLGWPKPYDLRIRVHNGEFDQTLPTTIYYVMVVRITGSLAFPAGLTPLLGHTPPQTLNGYSVDILRTCSELEAGDSFLHGLTWSDPFFFFSVGEFNTSTVATAPSPATSGTSLTVIDGSVFPAAPFGCIVWDGSTTAEKILVTSKGAGNNWTIVRAQGGTSARPIIVGDVVQITLAPSRDMLDLWPTCLTATSTNRFTTGGTSTTLTDSTQSWGTNVFAGSKVKVRGGGFFQTRNIVSNTATVLTVDEPWDLIPIPGITGFSFFIVGPTSPWRGYAAISTNELETPSGLIGDTFSAPNYGSPNPHNGEYRSGDHSGGPLGTYSLTLFFTGYSASGSYTFS